MKIFSIYDVKAEKYLRPFVEASIVNAVRGFEQLVKEGKSVISQYPNDFSLRELGEFDETTGMVRTTDIKTLCWASDFGPAVLNQ